MSLSAVGGDTWRLLPSRCRHPADTHHQGAIRVDGSADRQRVHVLGEKGLVGKSVADAAVIQDLKGRGGGGGRGGMKRSEAAEMIVRVKVITTTLAKVEEPRRARRAAGAPTEV